MESYFIPILIAAFQFGVRGGLGTAIAISLIYFPHIMLQWVGDAQHNLLAFLQIGMFNIIGYLTGLKAQKEQTEKNKYQETAQELKQSLDKLREQSVKLSDLEEQLRSTDRLAIVGELTASLAHELRNPLGTIRGTVDILNDELAEENKRSEFFQILVKETERVSEVVENYLNFARKQKNPSSEFDVREVVQNTSMILSSRARKENIRFNIDLPNLPLVLKGDPNDLRQILVNLILNAIQAMSEGGEIRVSGKVEFANRHPDTNQTHEKEYPCLQLSIKDQGGGMEPEALNKIFKPFYTTREQGTGLGLSIVKRIVDQHQWHIEVINQPGKGTEF
ncbi:MAG: hypothetical protein GWN16_13080, partial [Calditrichae bacterium]|nr:hypothetical protein [Calditrichia bacterium]